MARLKSKVVHGRLNGESIMVKRKERLHVSKWQPLGKLGITLASVTILGGVFIPLGVSLFSTIPVYATADGDKGSDNTQISPSSIYETIQPVSFTIVTEVPRYWGTVLL